MSRLPGASLQRVGRHFVYDNDPDSATRPDTVPAALRFAEASEPSSGVEHARPRVLQPYPRVPEITATNSQPTVVDPPLARPKRDLPSGTRHRPATPPSALASTIPPSALASTIPPPSHARQKIPRAEPAVAPPVTPAPVLEPARLASTSPPEPHPNRRWKFGFALVATAIASAFAGTSLGNGTLERAVGRVYSSPASRESTTPRITETPAPRSPAPAPSTRSLRPETSDAPVVSLAGDSTPPVIRVEDLPLAEQGTGRRVTRDGRRVRTKAPVRR